MHLYIDLNAERLARTRDLSSDIYLRGFYSRTITSVDT